jgi:hypothetical protein
MVLTGSLINNIFEDIVGSQVAHSGLEARLYGT